MDKSCFICGGHKVIWGNDWSFEDYGYEGEGIISTYSCMDCGAEYEVRNAFDEKEKPNE